MTSPDLVQLGRLLSGVEPLTWVMTGDSITHGLIHTQGERNYVDHMHELIRGDLGRVRDTVINTGISGWRVVQLLEDFDRRVAAWHPDVVTLMIGTNDCSDAGLFPVTTPADFAASVTEFVGRVRLLGAIPVLQTPPAIDPRNAPERARIGDFAAAVRAVAEAEDVILADQQADFAELGRGSVPWPLLGDPFHPNATGHAVIALGLAEVLGLGSLSDSRVLTDLRARVARR